MQGSTSGPWQLVATCSRGLEEVLSQELRARGAQGVDPGRGMVRFRGDLATIVDANLWLRTAMRVLVPLAAGRAPGRHQLYALAGSVDWEHVLGPRQTFAVNVAGRGTAFADASFAARVVKDAVVDHQRRRRGRRSTIDRRDPDIHLHLHLSDRRTTLSLDSTGEPLSHRGYRPQGGSAPLAESLAAGVLLLAGYDGSQPLLDPMCGAGTVVIEAALIATDTAPGLGRSFAFERWQSHDPRLLGAARDQARQRRRSAPAVILASDRDPRAVAATAANSQAAGVGEWIEIERRDLSHLEVGFTGGLVVTNPPYGHRLGEVEGLRDLYRTLGNRLKHHAAGNTAWLLVGSKELAKQIGLRTSRRVVLFNGPIECRLLRFDLYEGSADVPR